MPTFQMVRNSLPFAGPHGSVGANWMESVDYILEQVDLLWPEGCMGLKSYFLH